VQTPINKSITVSPFLLTIVDSHFYTTTTQCQSAAMEFLAANDQENLVHGFQTAAAAKPLNQGLKGYGSKTPGNKAPKTPFKIPLNDENAPFKGGKSVLKTNGKGNQDFLGGGKGGDLDKNAFITPAGKLYLSISITSEVTEC
jgi:hypothetical protein